MLMKTVETPSAGGSFPPVRIPAHQACHRVLIVDDDAAFAQTVMDAVADTDIDAVAVTDPREALRLIRLRPFAAAVVDLIMPEMDGLELARELRRASPATEVVMLTGHADMHSAIEGIRNELFDYLQKESLHSVRLRRAVRAAIARSELRTENRRLVSGLQDSTSKLQLLNDVSVHLAEEHHVDRLLAELVRAARELLGAEAVRVLLTDRNELGDMTIRSAFGDGDVALGGHFGPGDGIAARVLASETPLRVELPREHPNYSARCDELGTSMPGFICVPLTRPTLGGVLMAAGRARPFTDDEVALVASLARQAAVAIENAQSSEVSQNYFTHTSEMLVSLLDAQDPLFAGHSRAVATLADMLARRLGLSEPERRSIHFAALLHDVGKLRLAAGILASERPLSAEDLEKVRQHPALGVEVLRPISRWSELAPIIHTHHERWDGAGYPRGMAGQEIPMGGRIVAVAEAFEAMTRDLPRRKALTTDAALAEIEAGAGTQFDPLVARLFVQEYRLNRERLDGVNG
jgi:putative nucleotidyltransferase with HDIG domain